MKVDGTCHCGAIRYEAEVDPAKVTICHCSDCQRLSGTAFRVNVPAEPGSFRLIAGEPRSYIKTAESGRQLAQAFCGDCGSPMFATSVGEGPKLYGLRLGTIRQCEELEPRRQIWRHSAQHWVPDMQEFNTYPKAP